MIYFNQNTLDFLQNLAQNNNREWFGEHKSRFKQEVETPFKSFISDLIMELQPYIPNLKVNAKDCIFRIYKDIRFSKDKTPYKNHVSALISEDGRKNKSTPGLYVELSGKEFKIYSGCFQLTPQQIEKIRNHILNNLKEFNSLITNEGFKNTFGEIRGDKYKKIPAKYQEAAKLQSLFYNKSFYFQKKYDSNLVLKPRLIEEIINNYEKCLEINQFFRDGLSVNFQHL